MRERPEQIPPDLLDRTAAAGLVGMPVPEFLAEVGMHRLPAPAQRWEGVGRNRKACPKWRRAELVAADYRRRAALIGGYSGG